MKKAHILVVISIVVALLFAWMNVGLYESVDAASIKGGKEVDVSKNVTVDPRAGLSDAPEGRSLLQPVRREKRPALPEIVGPGSLPPVWILPLPNPPAPPLAWSNLRTRIVPVSRGGDTDTDDAEEDEGEGGEATDDESDVFEKKPERDMKKVARLVKRDENDIPVIVTPTGAFAGKPVWELLEKWPNVTFNVDQLNEKNGSFLGRFPVDAEKIANSYRTLHLEKTCENEYEEYRVRMNLRATSNDREAWISLAKWAREELSKTYGVEAIKKAIEALEKAKSIQSDLALTRLLAEYYRVAYDPEGELRTLKEFMAAGNTENAAVIKLLATVYERMGLHGLARELWEKAAASGDLGARLGLGNCYAHTGEYDAALGEFKKVEGSADRLQRAYAFEGGARVHIARGDFDAALAAATAAKTASETDPVVLATLGAAQYYKRRFADAAASFRAASNLNPPHLSRARSGLGFALSASEDTDAAKPEFDNCIANDPLNFFDPLAGLGDVYQRWDDRTRSTDYFETARQRDPGNPWILLRLATGKLRDGVPDQALTLANELIAQSPGCVDGLRVAAQAAAELAEPDYEQAIRHLERAVEKEPENAELIYEYVNVLIGAGRVEQALKVLEEATSVTGQGIARRDGRVLMLLAYTRFLAREDIDEVRDAINRAKTAQLDDLGKAYLDQMREEIEEWDSLRIYVDDFDRPAGQKLYGGWQEDDDRLGVQIGVTGKGFANFAGVVRANAQPRAGTSLSRSGDLKQFRELSAEYMLAAGDAEVVFHMYRGNLQLPQGADDGGNRRRGGSELGLAVDRDRKMAIFTTAGVQKGGGRRGTGAKLNVIQLKNADDSDRLWPDDGKVHSVRIERSDHAKGIFQVYFDGAAVGEEQEITGLAAQRNQEYTWGFMVDADRGTKVDVRIDKVELTKTVD